MFGNFNQHQLVRYASIFEMSVQEVISCSEDELKKKFRELAKKYHPDKNKDDKDAEKKFKEINEAYNFLKEFIKNRSDNSSFEFFRSGFNRGGYSYEDTIKQSFIIQRASITKTIKIRDIIEDKDIEINYTKYVMCDNCRGKGCSSCNNTGWKTEDKTVVFPKSMSIIDGGKYAVNDYNVFITSTGMVLRVPITVKMFIEDEDPSENIKRRGNDLIKILKINFTDLIKLNNNGKYKFKIYNREYQFGLNDIDQSSILYRYNGLPGSFGRNKGDLIVVLDVNYDFNKINVDDLKQSIELINNYINNQNSKQIDSKSKN